MTIAFFLGPGVFTLIRRMIAVYVIFLAINVLISGLWMYIPFAETISWINFVWCQVYLWLLAAGVVRRLVMLAVPKWAARWKIFDDAYLIGFFGKPERPLHWIWTPITMAALLISTVALIAMLIMTNRVFDSYESYQRYETTVAVIGLVLSAFGMLAGTRFVSGAKASLGGQFGVKYLADDHWLTQRVAMLSDKLGLQKRPEVGVTDVFNAFAMGTRANPTVVIGKPLIETLSEDELNAVIGHELGHIHSSDMQRMQFAEGFQRMLGNVILVISTVGIRAFARSRSDAMLGHAIGTLCRHTVFVGTELAVKGLSRSREYVADAIGAQLSSPDAMIGALERVHGIPAKPTNVESRYGYLMFKGASLGAFFSTHPTLDARVRELRKNVKGRDDGTTALRESDVPAP